MKILKIQLVLFRKGDRVWITTDHYSGMAEVVADQVVANADDGLAKPVDFQGLESRMSLVLVKPDFEDTRAIEVRPEFIRIPREDDKS